MRSTRIISLLSVALAVAAIVGPPAAAAPGGGGGAVAGAPAPSGTSGGATYGAAVPARKRHKHRASRDRASRASKSSGAHRFPIAGSFDWGGRDARFGAKRKGHRHQGQDLAAASGTPVVAPHAGVVEAVEYQASGAGNYVVLDSEGETTTTSSCTCAPARPPSSVGEHVRIGQRIGEVGSTGESSGPHLHFEIWVGSWYVGGHPIDPLPLLKAWA